MSSNQHVIITGAPNPFPVGVDPPVRKNINDLVKDPIQWSLFVRALGRMEKASQTDSLSQFGIGGIHGYPPVAWEGSGSESQSAGSWPGYCTHGTVLFPTWHRPYVALYEQTVQQHAAQIASELAPSNQQWKQAADALRFPYWDWASTALPPHQVIQAKTDAQIPIANPSGGTDTVANPLLGYTFHPVDPSFADVDRANAQAGQPTYYGVYLKTLRHPTNDTANAQSDVTALQTDLRSNARNWKTATYNLLTRVRDWNHFSNHTATGGQSVESIHDNVHVSVGGSGHMGDPTVAGFDKIFMLHHCNVDRLFALWQAINPSTYVTPGSAHQEGSTWTIPDNATLDANTSLTPFYNGASTYWTSTDARSPGSLHYIYPEFANLGSSSPTAVRAAIIRQVQQLYGPGTGGRRVLAALSPGAAEGAGATKQQVFQLPKDAGSQLASTVSNVASSLTGALGGTEQSSGDKSTPHSTSNTNKASHPGGGHNGSGGSGGQQHPTSEPQGKDGQGGLWDWVARVRVRQYQFAGSSFRVFVFLGPVPSNPADWLSSPSFVGSHACFVNANRGSCENCTRRGDLGEVTEGFVYLNEDIVERSGLSSLEPEQVCPYLKQNLHWRVAKIGNAQVRNEDTSSLVVDVLATWISEGVGDDLPTEGQTVHHHEVTSGKAGGHR